MVIFRHAHSPANQITSIVRAGQLRPKGCLHFLKAVSHKALSAIFVKIITPLNYDGVQMTFKNRTFIFLFATNIGLMVLLHIYTLLPSSLAYRYICRTDRSGSNFI